MACYTAKMRLYIEDQSGFQPKRSSSVLHASNGAATLFCPPYHFLNKDPSMKYCWTLTASAPECYCQACPVRLALLKGCGRRVYAAVRISLQVFVDIIVSIVFHVEYSFCDLRFATMLSVLVSSFSIRFVFDSVTSFNCHEV